jgi:UDP-N-acetylglucosamine 2-epimerase (non-hydrolysing)
MISANSTVTTERPHAEPRLARESHGLQRILCVVGTRPEVIKMAPVIHDLRRRPWAAVSVLCTAQHRDLAAPLLRYFNIAVDRVLGVMDHGQSLPHLTARLLLDLPDALAAASPHLVLAQGDTTTVMATAMACFYSGIRFAHVEAGLRTGNVEDPFPEEFNRLVASRLAKLNFAPTKRARENLLREGTDPHHVFVTGNTVVDALHWAVNRGVTLPFDIPADQRMLLLTLHRRESFGAPMQGVFRAVAELVRRNPDLLVVYPVHPNPAVSVPARSALSSLAQVTLCPPLDYPSLLALMRRAHLILTDSGGLQEEAPTFGKPVLITRQTTERPEGIEDGVACLVGTETERIVATAQRLLDDPLAYAAMVRPVSPFGDGKAAERIGDILEHYCSAQPLTPQPLAATVSVPTWMHSSLIAGQTGTSS